MSKNQIVGLILVAVVWILFTLEFITRRRHRNWKVDKCLSELMDKARHCEAEELDSLSIEVADYVSGLMWNSRKQKTKITSIIYFINGRQRQFRRGLIASARARTQGTCAPPPGE
jgi:hypothetical protein